MTSLHECAGIGQEAAVRKFSILELPDLVNLLLTPDQKVVFDRIFELHLSPEVPMKYSSPEALKHVAQRFRTSEDNMKARKDLRVTNIVLDEETLFNPIRLNRPVQRSSGDQIKVLEANNPSENCDLCHPQDKTPQDPFGDIETKHSITRANGGSYVGMNGMISPKDVHHPLEISREIFVDMMHTANPWLLKAYEYLRETFNIDAPYPLISWNVLPRAGASVFHPHLNVLLTDKPFQRVKDLQRRMADYQLWNGKSYLDDLAFAARGLGLVEDIESAHIIFNPTPRKEGEVLIYSNDGNGLPNGDFYHAAYEIISWWKTLGVTSFNMAVYLPPLGENIQDEGSWKRFYPFLRMVRRGDEGTTTSDFATMEIYASSVVSSDPLQDATLYKDWKLHRTP